MPQGLEDRIRELCAKAVAITDSPELTKILQQLKVALHEHMQRLRKMATESPELTDRRAN